MSIEPAPHPIPYAPPQHQLVLEIYVSNVPISISFYRSIGFSLDWTVPNVFVQFSWEGSILFLKVKDGSNPSQEAEKVGSGNIRIMVPDVDAKYEECRRIGHEIKQEIGDRLFVLRDFIVHDPDGFGVRFGSFLGGQGRMQQQNGPDHELVEKKIG